MASTRSLSPTFGGDDASEPGSPQLSPRSKLKAMLAAVDENSDDNDDGDNDAPGPIDMQAVFKSIDKSKTTSNQERRPTQDDEDEELEAEDEGNSYLTDLNKVPDYVDEEPVEAGEVS